MVISSSFGIGNLQREDVTWPGPSESMTPLDRLRTEWLGHLDQLSEKDLADGRLTGWPYMDDRAFALGGGWVSVELMKNVAEMCLIRQSTAFSADGKFAISRFRAAATWHRRSSGIGNTR